MTILILILAGVYFLSYTNGANDNFKGVATLYGSGTRSYRFAVTWASVFTFLGALAAALFAQELMKSFSGKGLVPDSLVQTMPFTMSVALASGVTVLLATVGGMPISTTHALTGALVGAGFVAVGSSVNLIHLGKVFLLPLLLSPLLAAILSYLTYRLGARFAHSAGITNTSCLCVSENEYEPLPDGSLAVAQQSLALVIAKKEVCYSGYSGTIFGITAQNVLDVLHHGSSAIVCFARGLNDAPKIAGLMLVFVFLDKNISLLTIALAMVIGGILNARSVAATMSKNITDINAGQGFSANAVTALLVLGASIFSLPVSTTHVSVGAIFGISWKNGTRNNHVLKGILLSWVFTLPLAALLSSLFYFFLSNIL